MLRFGSSMALISIGPLVRRFASIDSSEEAEGFANKSSSSEMAPARWLGGDESRRDAGDASLLEFRGRDARFIGAAGVLLSWLRTLSRSWLNSGVMLAEGGDCAGRDDASSCPDEPCCC